jgi:hypothetical protein
MLKRKPHSVTKTSVMTDDNGDNSITPVTIIATDWKEDNKSTLNAGNNVGTDLLTPILISQTLRDAALRRSRTMYPNYDSAFVGKQLSVLDKFSHYVQCVIPDEGGDGDATEGSVPFAYSVGIQWRMDHPDLIIVGMSQPLLATQLINDLAFLIARGELDLTKTQTIAPGVVANVGFRVEAVSQDKADNEFCCMTPCMGVIFDLPTPRYLQVIWPDRNGRFPTTHEPLAFGAQFVIGDA